MIDSKSWEDAGEHITWCKRQNKRPADVIASVQPVVPLYANWEMATAVIAAASQGMKDERG